MRWLIFLFMVMMISCTNSRNETEISSLESFDTTSVPATFFPVGSYLQGELTNIKKSYVNPMIIRITSGHADSGWVKPESLDSLFRESLVPFIDSSGYGSFYSESKFLDESLNAYTFTYEPREKLPDSIPWRSWTIYIDPESNAVKRIYLVKQISIDKVRQITWQPGNSYRAVTIVNGTTATDELIIKWKFDK